MQPHTFCSLRIRQKPNAIKTWICGRALVQENLRAARGGASGERCPVGQICRALDGVAQAYACGVAELETGKREALGVTENGRRRGNNVNGNSVPCFGSALVT